MSVEHTQKKRFIDKEIYQKSSYGSDVPSETYPPPFPHSKTSRTYLTPLPTPAVGKDVIYGWPLTRTIRFANTQWFGIMTNTYYRNISIAYLTRTHRFTEI